MINNFINRFRPRESAIHPKTDGIGDTANVDEDDEIHHQFDRPLEFVLSLISNSVGLGNVWRFPYLAARSGGGAFLIPYFILYFLIGAPMYFMELALGQFTSRGPATGFVLARGWQGVGMAMIINSVLGTLYYNVIIAWALFYFVLSFRKRLLWADCGYWWNTERCFVPGSLNDLVTENGTAWNCTSAQFANFSSYECQPINTTERVTASEEFYYRLLLKKSTSFDDFGTPTTYMSVSLLVSWILICVCIFRGVQSSGKVAYFTAIFPYVVLLVLIIFTATLEGAGEGIRFYLVPRWELIADFEIWQTAASQVFFSLSLSFGSLIAYAAANPFRNNFYKQMCIVVSCDCFTGLFAGFAVFATVGFLATSVGESVETYVKSSGPGLAFITYPAALARMPASPFFSIIFFLMLLSLGLGSQFASTDVVITALMEFFPSYAKRRTLLVVIACTFLYLVSLPFACPGGIYLFELFQEYTANTSLVVIGFFEVIVVAYIYGFNRFMNDVQLMLGKRAAEYYLFITWCITAPLLTIVLTVSNILSSSPLREEASAGFATYEYPRWSTILGWFIFVTCILPIPIVFVVRYVQQYRRIAAQRSLRVNTSLNSDRIFNNDDQTKPIYLAALTANNSPAETWGPRRKADQVGAYDHLRNRLADVNMFSRHDPPKYSSAPMDGANIMGGITNPVFDDGSILAEHNETFSSNRY